MPKKTVRLGGFFIAHLQDKNILFIFINKILHQIAFILNKLYFNVKYDLFNLNWTGVICLIKI